MKWWRKIIFVSSNFMYGTAIRTRFFRVKHRPSSNKQKKKDLSELPIALAVSAFQVPCLVDFPMEPNMYLPGFHVFGADCMCYAFNLADTICLVNNIMVARWIYSGGPIQERPYPYGHWHTPAGRWVLCTFLKARSKRKLLFVRSEPANVRPVGAVAGPSCQQKKAHPQWTTAVCNVVERSDSQISDCQPIINLFRFNSLIPHRYFPPLMFTPSIILNSESQDRRGRSWRRRLKGKIFISVLHGSDTRMACDLDFKIY